MKIGIIGTGNIGATLARQLTALGDDVSVANSRGPDTLTRLAAQTGATPVAATDIANDRQVVILAVPQRAVSDLGSAIGDYLPGGVVVVDAGNYVPTVRDGAIPELDAGMVESRWTEMQLRHPVVKALNTIGAQSLRTGARPAGAPERFAAPVAGDDSVAKMIVIGLLDHLGFDGFDAGGLDDSWRQQPGTPVYTADLPLAAVRTALKNARPEQTTEWRNALNRPEATSRAIATSSDPTHKQNLP
jgi:8-hydroxy-5-deazaflavin:NADPH oxidoreductase